VIKSHRYINRALDWDDAATEARRRRDEAVKQQSHAHANQQKRDRAAASAWSPKHEIAAARKGIPK
jgi:hypothetical protein